MKTFINKSHIEGEITYAPGDFILISHAEDFFSECIEIGQRFRFKKSPFAEYTHTALIINTNGDIIEATSKGVQSAHISKYKEYQYVKIFASQEDRNEMVRFALACIGDKYGFMTIASIALTLLTGGKFIFGIDSQMICSGLVARALERTSAIFPRDPGHIMPADLAQLYLTS